MKLTVNCPVALSVIELTLKSSLIEGVPLPLKLTHTFALPSATWLGVELLLPEVSWMVATLSVLMDQSEKIAT